MHTYMLLFTSGEQTTDNIHSFVGSYAVAFVDIAIVAVMVKSYNNMSNVY